MSRPAEPPFLPGFTYGLRSWRVVNDQGELNLSALVRKSIWNPDDHGPAVCLKSRRHSPPVSSCECGFYCYHQLPWSLRKICCDTQTLMRDLRFSGIMRGWGNIEVHSTGLRSQFAAIDVLFMPPRANRAYRALIQAFADEHNAEIWPITGPEEMLERIRSERPGLNPELIEELLGEDFEPGLVAREVDPATAERSICETRGPSPVKVKAHGYWADNGLPRFGPSRVNTKLGHSLCHLEL
ncbi:MAG: hypothetical protein WBW62_11555, partial [Solirubrobacterales bacterium]